MPLFLLRYAALLLTFWVGGCSLIDDFSQFRVEGDRMPRDSGPDDDDAGADGDASIPCGSDDCARLNSACARGECRSGQCVATAVKNGQACGGDDDKCTVCNDGACDAPKDCSAYDGPCTAGACDPSDGSCVATNVKEGQGCFDNKPCTLDERCSSGECKGSPKDCSGLDDQCSTGECDETTGDCRLGEPKASQTCDDFNPCTSNDQCDASGLCIATRSSEPGTACSDFNNCTGTIVTPDTCDGQGECRPGMAVLAGTTCEDDNECTGPDVCNATGFCSGASVRNGETCESACKDGNTCQDGTCLDRNQQSLGYKPECYFHWCDSEALCRDRLQRDGSCDCGCDFEDPDCDACSARMCEANASKQHRAAQWCDSQGNAITLCPDSLKNDGKCDCGCQFVDPDCFGGGCCEASDEPGCDNAFVEACVCEREGGSETEPSCCQTAWTERCVQRAVQLGCMACP